MTFSIGIQAPRPTALCPVLECHHSNSRSLSPLVRSLRSIIAPRECGQSILCDKNQQAGSVPGWNSEAQGQISGRYKQKRAEGSAHPRAPAPPCMPLRLHHVLLAAVLKKWKPQKVPKPPLSQQALPSLSQQWKPGSPAQPTTVPGVSAGLE